jgi:Protein of unknown function (DUF2530)
VKQTREPGTRLSPPPPLEGNDQLVTGIITAGWAIALIVLLIVRDSLPSDVRWWTWTCAAGLGLGLFGLWYLPRLKRSRTRAAQARAQARPARPEDPAAPDQSAAPEDPAVLVEPTVPDQSAPRASGSKTVSSTETPGRSTRS